MKRHGQPKVIVTNKLRSYGAGLNDLGMPDDRETGRWLNNRAENSHLPSDDGNAPYSAFAGCGPCRSSPLSTPQFITTSTRSAGFQAETISEPTAPPLSPSGAIFVRPNTERVWANRDWFAFV